jgi:hypothetical protein
MIFTSDGRRQWIFGIGLHGEHYSRERQQSWTVAPTVEWHPNTRFSLLLGPKFNQLKSIAQYVGTFDDPAAVQTYGQRFLFAGLKQTELSASVRLNWIFTPRLSLEVYAQPLLSSGEFHEYKELAAPKTYDFLLTGPPTVAPDDPNRLRVTPATPGVSHLEFDNPNFSLASLRGNAVLRWEYRPGSTIYFVWTQDRSDTVTDPSFRVGDGLDRLFNAPGNNVFLVKVSYWWRP